jgi:hypothetical protein
MKKLPLAIATISLLTTFSSFAETSTGDKATSPAPSMNGTQIFTQNFDVAVMKEPSIDIRPPEQEMTQISVDKLEELMKSGENLAIGEMRVKTTSTDCYAKVSTANNFKLKGMLGSLDNEISPTLASYHLLYKVNDTSTTDMSPNKRYAKFSSNKDERKKVGCDTANLEMNFFDYNGKAPSDIYTDIITVKVTAES